MEYAYKIRTYIVKVSTLRIVFVPHVMLDILCKIICVDFHSSNKSLIFTASQMPKTVYVQNVQLDITSMKKISVQKSTKVANPSALPTKNACNAIQATHLIQ